MSDQTEDRKTMQDFQDQASAEPSTAPEVPENDEPIAPGTPAPTSDTDKENSETVSDN